MAEENKETNENAENTEQAGVLETVLDTVTSTVSSVVAGATSVVGGAANALGLTGGDQKTERVARRAQKIGTVSSDKMTKTVVVKVDRQTMHPKYRRYIRRTTKFMAHDEMGAVIGDKVRIEETRPLSARKRWQVIEIVQKVAK